MIMLRLGYPRAAEISLAPSKKPPYFGATIQTREMIRKIDRTRLLSTRCILTNLNSTGAGDRKSVLIPDQPVRI